MPKNKILTQHDLNAQGNQESLTLSMQQFFCLHCQPNRVLSTTDLVTNNTDVTQNTNNLNQNWKANKNVFCNTKSMQHAGLASWTFLRVNHFIILTLSLYKG